MTQRTTCVLAGTVETAPSCSAASGHSFCATSEGTRSTCSMPCKAPATVASSALLARALGRWQHRSASGFRWSRLLWRRRGPQSRVPTCMHRVSACPLIRLLLRAVYCLGCCCAQGGHAEDTYSRQSSRCFEIPVSFLLHDA